MKKNNFTYVRYLIESLSKSPSMAISTLIIFCAKIARKFQIESLLISMYSIKNSFQHRNAAINVYISIGIFFCSLLNHFIFKWNIQKKKIINWMREWELLCCADCMFIAWFPFCMSCTEMGIRRFGLIEQLDCEHLLFLVYRNKLYWYDFRNISIAYTNYLPHGYIGSKY